MSVLYPPYIEGKLPSFYTKQEDETIEDSKITEIKIPFIMNPAVSQDSFSGMALKLKSLYNNDWIKVVNTTKIVNNVAVFDVTDLQKQKDW